MYTSKQADSPWTLLYRFLYELVAYLTTIYIHQSESGAGQVSGNKKTDFRKLTVMETYESQWLWVWHPGTTLAEINSVSQRRSVA